MLRLGALTLMILAITLSTGNANAQQQGQQISFHATAKDTKYVQVHDIAVGDVPNHIIRVFEIHRTYPDNPPVIDGVKLVDWWVHGMADVIDGNGSATEYEIYIMENGDKFFGRANAIVQKAASGKQTAVGTGFITGGTGKLVGIQGVLRASSNIDLKAGVNENQAEIEYSIVK